MVILYTLIAWRTFPNTMQKVFQGCPIQKSDPSNSCGALKLPSCGHSIRTQTPEKPHTEKAQVRNAESQGILPQCSPLASKDQGPSGGNEGSQEANVHKDRQTSQRQERHGHIWVLDRTREASSNFCVMRDWSLTSKSTPLFNFRTESKVKLF